MNSQNAPACSQPDSMSLWERWASLLGRLIIIFSMVYVPIVFFTWTWRHYNVPKTASFQFLVLMLMACWGVIAVRRRFVRSALAAPAAFFFMIVMITSLVSVNLAEAWETVTFLAACMIFMVLIPKFMTRFKDFEILVYILGILCLVVDLYALAQKFSWMGLSSNPDYFFFLKRLTEKPVSFMGNENYAAEFLNMTLPICFAMMICYRRNPAQLIFFTIVSLLNFIVMVYIDCNATFAGFIAAVPIATVIMIYFKAIPWSKRMGLFQMSRHAMERRFRQFMILLVLGLCVLATLAAVAPNGLRTKMASMCSWMDVDGDLIPDGVAPIVFRLQCMDAAARNIMDAPILGIGAGNFKVEHPLYESQLERKVLGEETLARKVHNDHLWHAVEFGVFGLFGWYWIIVASFFAILASLRYLEYQSIAANPKERNSISYKGIILPAHKREFYFYLQWGTLTGLIVAIVSCAFGHTFVIPSSAIIYWLLSGLCVAVYQNLHFASRGIRNHVLGVTSEPLNPIQKKTRMLPGAAWYGILFLLVFPFSILNTYQLIGETWLRHGMTEQEDNNYYGMFKCFEKSMNYYPYQMETFYILGRYYIDAVIATEEARYATTTDKLPQLPMGLNFEDRRKMNEEGIAVLQTDIFMNPNYKWAHNNLGVLYDRYYDLMKPNGEGYLYGIEPEPELAESLMAASVQTYNRVLAIDKEQIFAHFNLGLGAIKLGQFDKAIEPLNQALITDPTRYDIYEYLSNCFCQTKEYKRALRAAEKYMEKTMLAQLLGRMRRSSNPKPYQQILQALRDNDYAQAAQMARLAMRWQNRKVYNLYLAIASEMINQPENPDPDLTLKAVDMAEKVIATHEPEHYLWHAKIYEELGKLDKAAEQIVEYLRVRPNDNKTRHMLMMLYVQQNDLAQAQKTMSVLVQNEPKNWQYLVTYSRLLVGVNTPWAQVFPFVQRAIELGGDDARRLIADDKPGNLILPYVKKDSRMIPLLGPNFLPSSQTQSATP